MKTTRTSRTFRTLATVAALAGSTFIAAPHASAATTQFGQCDFGTPSLTNFRCVDSDDLGVRADGAHTDNGPLSDKLDIDWYINEANDKFARIHGDLRLGPGITGVATMKMQCVNQDGSIDTSRTVVYENGFGFSPGISKDVSFICAGKNLAKVRVSLHMVGPTGRVADDSGAREFGD